ncbi:twin-arginine translocase subunit TatC [uncultured Aquimarina sp.]|uniref:twin-arginine translocase subunit TatC n=1 Tax=uncultured Aquimarina sp. TaxID=575652 RepID=UPI00261A2A0C|nr:twin-arginine translocase subunit TatC [uncultured Aquimarina sp.]
MSDKTTNDPQSMSFLDHLEELRWHLIRMSLAIILIAIVAFVFIKSIFTDIIFALRDPNFISYEILCKISRTFGMEKGCLEEMPFNFISTEMAGQFSAAIWTSITTGFVVAFPYILHEFWKFISPALYENERKHSRGFIIVSSLLFFIGTLFGYFVIAPLSVNFLATFSIAEVVDNQFKIGSYISLVRASVIASGFIFELPIIIYFLSKVGLVTPEFLRRNRKYALVIVLILAAVITPPDISTQIIVAIPILILYEVSIFISKMVIKRQNKKILKSTK